MGAHLPGRLTIRPSKMIKITTKLGLLLISAILESLKILLGNLKYSDLFKNLLKYTLRI